MQMFYIWNHDKGLWRKAHLEGFTSELGEAGTYISKRAIALCSHANRDRFSERMIPISLIDNIRCDRVDTKVDFDAFRLHRIKVKKNDTGVFARIESQLVQIEHAKTYIDMLLDDDSLSENHRYIAQQAKDKLLETEFSRELKEKA